MSGITCSGTTQRSDMHACSLQHITCVIAMQLTYAGRSLQSHDVSSAVVCDRQKVPRRIATCPSVEVAEALLYAAIC